MITVFASRLRLGRPHLSRNGIGIVAFDKSTGSAPPSVPDAVHTFPADEVPESSGTGGTLPRCSMSRVELSCAKYGRSQASEQKSSGVGALESRKGYVLPQHRQSNHVLLMDTPLPASLVVSVAALRRGRPLLS